jgi:hypothetical protein
VNNLLVGDRRCARLGGTVHYSKTDTLTGQKMSKADLLTIASPGSRPLKNARYERYCRLRALLQPRAQAYREAGWHSKKDNDAYANACRLERRAGVKERIEYLSHQAEERIVEKRRKLEEQLWAVHEAKLQDYFEQYAEPVTDKQGNPKLRMGVLWPAYVSGPGC